ncbi:hypothetical protein C3L33_22126, partial [Rhododendron williamsianum]
MFMLYMILYFCCSFHLDHAASLPYFLEKTTFKGRVFMTHATKAIYKLLLSDYVKVSKVSVEDMLYDEQDILRSMDKIEVIDFHQTLEVNGIRFWCYTAGHVLGAAMFMVDIAGVRVLYTGDYSREEDRHLRAAELPQFSPDICIIESTYGVQLHQPRHIREKRFTDVIHSTISQGGRVLIPAFALGRAQELLLILDEYWSNHPELHNIPIYYASPLAKRCMAVYQTYINAMNERIRNQFANSNPFDFKHISPLKSIENFNDVGPSVVMASPSALQSGLSRQLFDKWFTTSPSQLTQITLRRTSADIESVESSTDEESGVLTLRVHDRVTVKQESDKHISVHWNADPISDMVSDSIVALVLNVSREMPKIVEEPEPGINEEENKKKFEKICHALLVSLFGDVKQGENGKLLISVDGNVAHLDKQVGTLRAKTKVLGKE